MQYCSKCKTIKPLDQFAKGERKNGTNHHCKVCNKVYRDARKNEIRDYQLRYSFGISLDDYNKMLEQQHGVCAICFKPEVMARSLAVDHDHVTGKVRGLLCGGCNRGIGYLMDDPKLMINAYEYLTERKYGRN